METKLRSVVKTISYRIGGVFVTGAVAWMITGNPLSALQIGLADTFAKLVVFYLHERAWNKISFGRVKAPEYQI
ncbi:MAG TPA: DUF2061 domain-containing protein [Candidatus Omnitrophota bacterium]|nr:DUF2061 domain-containing protein [Candidatus Omnitrophota bacterium]